MSQAHLSKLWSSVDQVMRDDERKGALGPTIVGLQCGGRELADFVRDQQAGVRDGVALFADYVLIVRTPPNPGVRTIFKAMRKGGASVVPHSRLPRSAVKAVEVTSSPPPGWRLTGEIKFLRITTSEGDVWHWLDEASMSGKEERLAEMLSTYSPPRAG
ncbi:MAG TPA: hypothetical protein VI039_01725 [Solirubrobacterales bacterium]